MGAAQSARARCDGPPGAAGCPVDHGKKPAGDGCPVDHGKKPAGDGCPVDHSKRAAYNVYNEKIDPTNNMPAGPVRQWPGQKKELPTQRVKSTIPKGGTDSETWTYPSPQQFFSAIRRKAKPTAEGETEETEEEHIETVVKLHNNMNEKTWRQIQAYEALHCDSCPTPKLMRFLGRPDDLTPKARVRSWLGQGLPFDRHDWYVDRCGTEVRYVIDYYHDEAKGEQDSVPETMFSSTAVKSITMEARPALDSAGALWDRLRLPVLQAVGSAPAPPAVPEAEAVEETTEAVPSRPPRLMDALRLCTKAAEALQECQDEQSCGRASLALNMCLGKQLCADQTAALRAAIETGGDMDGTNEAVMDCLRGFEAQ